MKLGLLGGTFDPVHMGHLILAENCLHACQLDALWFLPTGIPPHKDASQLTPGADRVAMLQLAVAGHPQFSVHTIECDRAGVAYTVDTLEQVHREHPQAELAFLIGGDSLCDLPNWRSPQRIAELAQLVAVNRGGNQRPPIPENLAEPVVSRIQQVSIPGIEISATEIRQRVRSGMSIRYLVPRAVEIYIEQHGLYQDSPTDRGA